MLTETEAGGLFLVSSFTKNETLRELVEVSLEEVRRFREGGPAEEELARTKRYMNGTFPLALETGDQLAHHLADMKRFGRDPDWLQHYRDRVREASVEEVTELARRYFLAKGWALAVVGDARALAPQLKPFSKEIEVLSSAKRLV
jgi:zinc protease